jgi:hypothetical protein
VYEVDPMDTFLSFIESSDLSMWVRGDSMLAFPTIITAHTICMGLLAGTSSAIGPAWRLRSRRKYWQQIASNLRAPRKIATFASLCESDWQRQDSRKWERWDS